MSLVFSPVARCSVEPYAISVGLGVRGRQTLGAYFNQPKWHVVSMCVCVCVKQWLSESVCTCISVSRRPEVVSHIQQGPILITW